jgi:hypothetical protein
MAPEPGDPLARHIDMRVLVTAAVLVSTLVLTACGSPTTRSPAADETPAPSSNPPPIRLLVDGDEVDAFQGSYCWQSSNGAGLCVDSVGAALSDLPDVGSPASLTFRFPLPDTTFTAYFDPVGRGCTRVFEGTAVDAGDGDYRLAAAGPAGRYRVSLIGRAPQGEAPGEFVWTTPVAGDLGEPAATMGIVWKPHQEIESSGFLLNVADLARTPQQAAARVTVTAADGASRAFDAGKAHLGCPEQGYVSFSERGDSLGAEVVDLGPPPFTYHVALDLDGTTYSGVGSWPTDEIENTGGSVRLTFTPPLPALSD